MKTDSALPAVSSSLIPYLLVRDVDRLLGFYAAAFGAETLDRSLTSNGIHSAFKVGDSTLMMGGPVERRKATLHLYVDDLEATVQRALDAGGVSTYPITQAPYGERFAVVEDPGGNAWIVAERATSTLRHSDMHTVTPYLNPRNAATLIEFLEAGLGAEVLERHHEEPRGVVHCKVRIGASILELGDPENPAVAFPVMLYMYVDDVEATYQRALRAGAASISSPSRSALRGIRGGLH